jgi:NDP-sugar pyrophosphorylase family protein
MNTKLDALSELIEIGEGFISAPGSVILTHDASTIIHCGKVRVEKTIIGKNVFLGLNAVVLPGIKVGNGSIIGAGSIVTKDVPENVIVVGNPARIVSTVDKYLEKCKERDVLYDLTDPVLAKHGTRERSTPEETANLLKFIYQQYEERNVKAN